MGLMDARQPICVVLADATSAGVPEAHAAVLGMLGRTQPGVVMTVAEVEQQWEALRQLVSDSV